MGYAISKKMKEEIKHSRFLSQKDFAGEIGISKQMLNIYLNEKCDANWKIGEIQMFCKALGITVKSVVAEIEK